MRRFIPSYSLRTLLLVVTLVAAAAAAFSHARNAYQRDRVQQYQARFRHRLHIMVDLLKILEKQAGNLPSVEPKYLDGTPRSSWRLQASSQFRDIAFRGNVNATWDDPANDEWAISQARLFCLQVPDTPADLTFPPRGPVRQEIRTNTNVVAITGPDTLWDEAHPCGFAEAPPDLIVLAEVQAVEGFHWMKPGDLDVQFAQTRTPSPAGLRIGGNFPNGFHVAVASGEVWLLAHDTPAEILSPLFTISGARQTDAKSVLGSYAIWQVSYEMNPELRKPHYFP